MTPKPSTFQTTEKMIAYVEVSASTPSHNTGWSMTPRSCSILLTRPKRGLNSQYHSRLELPRPITTGINTTPRVKRLSVVLSDVRSAIR